MVSIIHVTSASSAYKYNLALRMPLANREMYNVNIIITVTKMAK